MSRFGPAIQKLEVSDVRSSESFSHLVVMLALGKLFSICRVVEFGAGEWSTPFFLNREAFPDLEYLESYEDSLHWYNQVSSLVKDDSRCVLRHATVASEIDLSQFNLCLIDDNLRVNTIKTVVANYPAQLITVIHDYENPDYQVGTGELNRFVVTQVRGPLTCIVWKGDFLNQAFFDALLKVIEEIK